MKALLFLLLLCLPIAAQNVNVTLTWDKHPEPDVAEYFVHYGTQPGIYTVSVQSSTNLVTIPIARGMTYFVVTAKNTGGFVSEYPPEFVYFVRQPGEIRIPAPVTGTRAPKELNSARIEKSNDLRTWVPVYFTTDPIAFFRLVVSS